MHDIIIKLIEFINTKSNWHHLFQDALSSVLQYDLDEFTDIYTLEDWLIWCNDILTWVPIENPEGTNIDHKLIVIYFLLNQPSLNLLTDRDVLLQWMIEYAQVLGAFYDSTDSFTVDSLQSFYRVKTYRLQDYMQDPSGWKTFNQFFARRIKPGYRVVDNLCDDNIIVSVADSVYKGALPIRSNSTITVKDITWSICELLNNNPYSLYFKDGIFMHAYLSPYDYHRLHMPVCGKILYTEIVHGNVYFETYVVKNKLRTRNSNYVIKSRSGVGYQFTQARGIIIVDSPIGIIAILPVGMSLVSSIVITAEVGKYLRKGEEFGYFQFGGSDYIMLLPEHIKITAKIGEHYNQGMEIACNG